MSKRNIAILIPAHNEAKVIQKTIDAALLVVSKKDVYVVDDGSTDNTPNIAIVELGQNVITISTRGGKAEAMSAAFNYFNLINRYNYIMPIDADTVISVDFIKNTLPILKRDTKKQIACVVGKVMGVNHRWITTYRVWEYEIAQSIHKHAQSIEDAVIICPGCSTVYRSEIFKKIQIPTGTLTEDMDLTFLIHREKLGKIVYNGESKVITQDPAYIKDYVKQLNRWYTGFWQCLIKHNIPWGGQMLDFEVGLIALEGLFNGILVASLIFLIPFVLKINPLILAIPAGVDFFLFMIPTVIYTGIKNKIYHIFLYIPFFYFLRFLSSLIFLYCFMKVVLSFDLKMTWYKAARY
ncbi:MAG TPA: glycosyltransferase family 2 protein [Candidatus Saccharimonadales bacterium]|nr:glycosyltransferase family 2 protein [Candidatus Saccharimonadales bacterium]